MTNILEEINESALKLLSPLTPEETYKTIVEEAVHLIDASFGSIILAENNVFNRVYSSTPDEYNVKSRKNGNTYKSFTEQKVLIIPIEESEIAHPSLKKSTIKWTIFIPLSYEEKAIGVLILNSIQDLKLDKSEIHGLTLFGSMATLAIRKAQLYTQTKNALQTRDLFISLASHELRTPLTSINGYIHLLHSKLSKSEGAEGKWIKELYEESKRLTNLVTELLEINRIKQGQLHFNLEECNITQLINQAIERYHMVNPKRIINYSNSLTKQESMMIGDFEKLLQMITALINNADKFSPQNEPIEILTKSTRAQIIIQVNDQGSGIAREDITKIFGGFYKGDFSHEGGLGVGLLLSKHIISYHHGTIEVKSKSKKGTTVEVRFPHIH